MYGIEYFEYWIEYFKVISLQLIKINEKKKNIRVFTAKKRKITLTPWNWLDTSTTADVTIIFAPGITDMNGPANDIFPTATAKVQNCSMHTCDFSHKIVIAYCA